MPRPSSNYAHVEHLSAVSEELANDLEALGREMEKAVTRAMKKVAAWLRTHAVREIGRELKIGQKALKKRFHINNQTSGDGASIEIWFGLLNIAAHELGDVSQKSAGAKVGRNTFEGAFKKRIYGDQEKVYIRARRNWTAGHATVSQRPNRRDSGYGDDNFINSGGPDGSSNRGRFPVQVVGVEIEEQAQRVMKSYEGRINARYQKILQQEVNYILNVESRA